MTEQLLDLAKVGAHVEQMRRVAVPHAVRMDVVIFGGGGAGLWLLDVLLERGLIPDPRIGKNAAECAWVFETPMISGSAPA